MITTTHPFDEELLLFNEELALTAVAHFLRLPQCLHNFIKPYRNTVQIQKIDYKPSFLVSWFELAKDTAPRVVL